MSQLFTSDDQNTGVSASASVFLTSRKAFPKPVKMFVSSTSPDESESRWYPVTICWEYQSPESPLDCKEIKPFNLKGNQPLILIGRTDAEAETPVFSSSDVNS